MSLSMVPFCMPAIRKSILICRLRRYASVCVTAPEAFHARLVFAEKAAILQ